MTAVVVRSYSPSFELRVRAARDEQIRGQRGCDVARALLVSGVRRRPQEADREGHRSRPHEVVDGGRGPRSRSAAPAPRPRRRSARHRADQVARHERGRLERVRDIERLIAGEAPRCAPCPFMTNIRSSWPRVASSPTLRSAPLDDRVGACRCAVHEPIGSGRAAPRGRAQRDAARSMASKNPRERSAGVVGALPVVIAPAPSMTAQSVNVPPMSTPTGQPGARSCRRLVGRVSFTSSTGGSSGCTARSPASRRIRGRGTRGRRTRRRRTRAGRGTDGD